MADGLYSITLGGDRASITIKQPLTAHTTPEQLSDELRRCAGREGGAVGGGERSGEKRAHSAELECCREAR